MKRMVVLLLIVSSCVTCIRAQDETIDKALKGQVDKLIQQLASESFKERDEATKKLREIADKVEESQQETLEKYFKTKLEEAKDEEVKHRLEVILDESFMPRGPLFEIYVKRKCGFIDRNGKVVIEPKFDNVSKFSDGLAYFSMGRESIVASGIINKKGKVVIQSGNMFFSPHDGFSEGFLPFYTSDRKWGYADKNGKVMIKPQFNEARSFSDSLAAVKVKEKWGFIDKSGKMVIQPEYWIAGTFISGIASVYVKRGERAYIDKTGKVILKVNAKRAGRFVDGVTYVARDGKYVFIDKTGKKVFPEEYEGASEFAEGLAPIKKDGKWGYIDRKGKMVIQPKYEGAFRFSEGLAAVYTEYRWGFIDKTGKFVIKPKLGEAESFQNGLASVTVAVNSEFVPAYIDKTGKVVWKSSDYEKALNKEESEGK